MKKCMTLAMVALFGCFIAGCGGGGSSANETKPMDQVQAEAKTMDTAKLQATVDTYKAQIASKQGELDKLAAKIKELQPDLSTTAKSLVGGLTGSADAKSGTADLEKAKAEITKLQESSGKITESIKALQERMDVYVKQMSATK
jgi:peptidoglycan hydrolase CwlO-like protein